MTFFRFADGYFLWLFVLIPLLFLWYFWHQKRGGASVRFSNVKFVKAAAKSRTKRAKHFFFGLRMLGLACLMFAFARPQSGIKGEEVITQGIDIMLAMDVSSSMLAEDLKPNRLEAAKDVASDFIRERINDRIGMVIFSGDAFTQCPLTIDYGILMSLMDSLRVGMIEDGTAIGMGLATAVNRLRSSEAKSKVIILLTDGRNNRGEIDPITAAQAAQAFNVKIYTIGAGTRGSAMYPVNDPFLGKRYVSLPVDIDEESLQKIANMTGGQYFRATNRESLKKIYKEIDSLEKTQIKVNEYTRYSEKFYIWIGFGLILLLCEIVLANTRFRKIP